MHLVIFVILCLLGFKLYEIKVLWHICLLMTTCNLKNTSNTCLMYYLFDYRTNYPHSTANTQRIRTKLYYYRHNLGHGVCGSSGSFILIQSYSSGWLCGRSPELQGRDNRTGALPLGLVSARTPHRLLMWCPLDHIPRRWRQNLWSSHSPALEAVQCHLRCMNLSKQAVSPACAQGVRKLLYFTGKELKNCVAVVLNQLQLRFNKNALYE